MKKKIKPLKPLMDCIYGSFNGSIRVHSFICEQVIVFVESCMNEDVDGKSNDNSFDFGPGCVWDSIFLNLCGKIHEKNNKY